MCDRVVSEAFLIAYCPKKYKNQIMCDEAVDDYLAESNLFLIDFFNVKCLKKLVNALHTNDVILFYNEDFNKTLLFLVKDIFLLGILIELNLKMIMSFIKMILIL